MAATPALPAVNPGHWTEDMRADALSVADLSDSSLKVNASTTCNNLAHRDHSDARLLSTDQKLLEVARANFKMLLEKLYVLVSHNRRGQIVSMA